MPGLRHIKFYKGISNVRKSCGCCGLNAVARYSDSPFDGKRQPHILVIFCLYIATSYVNMSCFLNGGFEVSQLTWQTFFVVDRSTLLGY